jgi:hypothetical protein
MSDLQKCICCIGAETRYAFAGFQETAFEALDRLRENPTVEQLRADRARIQAEVVEPFRLFRDDLVVHWVLPRGASLETERNVFSRLVKNDFGAGGAHSHLWLAFYRHGRTRLTDLQLSHSLSPEGFSVSLYASERAGATFAALLRQVHGEPARLLQHINDLLSGGFVLSCALRGVTRRSADHAWSAPLAELPEELHRARAVWVTSRIPRDQVVASGTCLVCTALALMADLEPLYQWIVDSEHG